MTLRGSKTSRFRMLALLAAAGTVLSACTPTPEPSPSPTAAFASEEEAFAAAEETYRAYLAAAADRADGKEDANPAQYLSGEALEADVQSQRDLRNQGLRIIGASSVAEFNGTTSSLDSPLALLVADICIDISHSRVLNDQGDDVTPTSRPERGRLTVEFQGDATQLLISDSAPSETSEC